MRVLVVTPTYDEAGNIEAFLRRTRAALPDADLMVVDDASPDGTADLVARVGADLGRVEVIRRPGKQGVGVAYREAFAVGLARGYDVIAHLDADLSHDPDALPAMIERLRSDDADLVIGSRYVPGGSIPNWSWFRRALSESGNLYARIVLGMDIRDSTSGYRVYRASALRAIDFTTTRARGYGFEIEMAYRTWCRGGRVVEFPIAFTDREHGYSKMSFEIASEELLLVTWWGVRDRTRRALERARTCSGCRRRGGPTSGQDASSRSR